jgi:hypothetical protein
MTRQGALNAVRATTHDYLVAVETQVLDEPEVEWLDWLRMRSVVRARDLGVAYEDVKAAVIEGILEVTG